jgi:uncharacterized protein (TIGR02145 family)
MKKLTGIFIVLAFLSSCKKDETLPDPVSATITTIALTEITSTSAISGGNITRDGGGEITERGICYNTSTTPTTDNSKVKSGTGSGSYTAKMTDLKAGKTYYVRAYAINCAGTAYGNELSFFTPYQEVSIGTQVWMLKNIDVSTYRNGDPIPQVTDPAAWAALTTGAWCWYNNDSAMYASTYGKLYNWYAVNDSRGLAPTGWHVPSDAEWTSLTNFLGGFQVAGNAMKEKGTKHWNDPNDGATNSSGYTALPGGSRNDQNGSFTAIFEQGHWWSTTEENSVAKSRWLTSQIDNGYLFSNTYPKQNGFSVRCVRD